MNEFTTLRMQRAEPDLGEQFSGDWLHLDQKDWPDAPDGGFFSWAIDNNLPLSLESLNEYFAIYKSNCSDDGSCEIEVEVRRSRPDLAYTLTASYGELSERFSRVEARQESRTISAADEIDLQLEISGELTAVWEGPVFGMDGSQILPPPSVENEGSVLSFGQKVAAGVLRLSYSEEYDTYTLTIQPREPGEYELGDLDAAYQSTVIAIWGDGEVESMDIDPPEMSGNCNGMGSRVFIDRPPGDPDDPGDPDSEKCYKHILLVDPCTGEIKEEWDEEVAC